MKTFLSIALTLSIIPVSIAGMIFGWGLTAENWGWIAFSYLWIFISPILITSLGE